MSPIPVPSEIPELWITQADWEGRSFWLGVLVRATGSVEFLEAESQSDLWSSVESAGWPRRNYYGQDAPAATVSDQIIDNYPGIKFPDLPFHYRVLP